MDVIPTPECPGTILLSEEMVSSLLMKHCGSRLPLREMFYSFLQKTRQRKKAPSAIQSREKFCMKCAKAKWWTQMKFLLKNITAPLIPLRCLSHLQELITSAQTILKPSGKY